jgi:hypothetical protein
MHVRNSSVHGCSLLAEKSNFLHIYDFGMYVSFVCINSCMIAHDHVDVKYAHYGLDFYPGDANHIVGSFAKLLRDLKSPPTSSSRASFTTRKCSLTKQKINTFMLVCALHRPI